MESAWRTQGPANAALEAAHRVGPSGRVVGVDLGDSMQARAQAKARAQELANVHFQQVPRLLGRLLNTHAPQAPLYQILPYCFAMTPRRHM